MILTKRPAKSQSLRKSGRFFRRRVYGSNDRKPDPGLNPFVSQVGFFTTAKLDDFGIGCSEVSIPS